MGLRDLTNYFKEQAESESGFINMDMRVGMDFQDTAIMMPERMNDDVEFKDLKIELF